MVDAVQPRSVTPSMNKLDAMLEEYERMLNERDARIDQLNAALSDCTTEKRAVEDTSRKRQSELVEEIVALTRLLREQEDASDWLHKVTATLVGDSRRGRLAKLLAGPLAYVLQNAQLRRRDLFDSAAYLRANPDVARAGGGALRHYILYGLKEGRKRR